MVISPEPIIYGLIFIAVLVLVEGVYLTVFGKSISLNSRVNRRLTLLEKGAGREKVLEQLRKEMSQHIKSKSIPIYSLLAEKAQKANIAFSPIQLIIMMVVLSGVAFVGLSLGTSSSVMTRTPVAIGMGVAGVYVWLNRKAAKRMSLIEEQLPDAVELMVRSLRVGHPFSNALAAVAKETPDPLGTEMGIISDEAAYGRDIGDSLKAMADRIGTQDMRFLAVAVSIQSQAGGNLADILDGLAKVIRARFRLFRRVKAITSEAQWSGKFLSGFPVLALIGINLLKPDYYDKVKESSYWVPACLIVAGFLIANIFVMRALVNIKV